MLKRIIFDMDNTLMDFPKNYEIGYKQLIDKYNLNITPFDLYEAIGVYETCGKYDYYNEELLIDLINKELNLNLNVDFIKSFFEMYDKYITDISDSVKKTLEYLSSKYEVVVLTNWFTNNQKNRLKYAGIDIYFKKVYGGDIVKMKPNREAFLSACGEYDVSECVMIGDNLNIDIKVPYEMGMNVYYFSNNINDKYPTINKIEQLKELL